jgi:hypothetical protein
VYFLILYKPVSLLYKLSGVMVTGLLLSGYGITIANIVYTNQSSCRNSSLGTVSNANAIVFLVVASLVLLFSHTIIWFPICRNYCGKRKQAGAVSADESMTNHKMLPPGDTSSAASTPATQVKQPPRKVEEEKAPVEDMDGME